MTLALYGKSRRRKGALLTAALLAVIVATVGALGAITSAFAHHTEYAKSGTCDGWTAHAGYVGGSGKRLVIIENVTIGGTNYQASWSTGFATGAGTSNGIQTYSGGNIDGKSLSGAPGGVASGTNVKYWFGVDSSDDPSRPDGTSYDWTIFKRSGSWPAGTFSGRILQFIEGTGNNSGKWVYQSGESVTSLDAPTRPSNCDRTIRIVKVTEGSGRPSTGRSPARITKRRRPTGR
ncbi:MAG: hypothetical protein KatS3mg064_1114 [Tepidiforma sp.]|nr:hypothetical protein [Tepidiforma sp.]GIW17957.1 MAG: hypothetical protein KatS3mg064_1114 [Tepidiforma sp.]